MLSAAGVVALIMLLIMIFYCIKQKKVRISPNNELMAVTNIGIHRVEVQDSQLSKYD